MTPDEHRAEAEQLLADVVEHRAVGALEHAGLAAQMATAHAVLAQTPQPVTAATEQLLRDVRNGDVRLTAVGLADMLMSASVAGSGDGQAILAGRAMAREPEERCVCGHRETRHAFGGVYCLVGDPRCPCSGYEPVGSEPGGEE